jgi:hypothetical protein
MHVSPMNGPPTGASLVLKKTMTPSTEISANATDMKPFGRGSPPNARAAM